MSHFIDLPDQQRFEQGFIDTDGVERMVFADYAVRGEARVIMHVEADPLLRGSGAAGRFMQALTDHARSNALKLHPTCSYAVAWHRRHPESQDVLA